MADLGSASGRPRLSILGIGVRIHISWLIFAVFIAWSLASGELPMLYAGLPRGAYWAMAAMIVVGLAISIVLHEFAHALVGRAMGIQVGRITLFLFGGVAELREEPKRPKAELAMALAGPAFSVAFSIALALASGAVEDFAGPQQVVAALSYLATLNLVLAAFNMAPAFPLDGGRVLRALIWMATRDPERATRAAARTGQVLAVLLMGLGLLALFGQGVAGGLWWILIGLFIYGAAQGTLTEAQARKAFTGHTAREVMVRPVETAPADLTLDRFVAEHLLSSRHGLYPVVSGRRWLGVVSSADVLSVPRERWADTTLADVCTPPERAPAVSASDEAAQVLERMQRHDTPRLLVVEGEEVVGIVTLKDLLGRIELQRRLGLLGQGRE